MKLTRTRSLWITLTVLYLTFGAVQAVHAGFGADYNKVLKNFQSAKRPEDYKAAALQFGLLAERKDAGMLQSNCFYWLGECWYELRDYVQALNCFEKVLIFPKSNKEEAARYKVALCYVRLDWSDSARWELARFLRDFPASALVAVVKKELEKLPAVKGN
jgi:TolA-binding protein